MHQVEIIFLVIVGVGVLTCCMAVWGLAWITARQLGMSKVLCIGVGKEQRARREAWQDRPMKVDLDRFDETVFIGRYEQMEGYRVGIDQDDEEESPEIMINFQGSHDQDSPYGTLLHPEDAWLDDHGNDPDIDRRIHPARPSSKSSFSSLPIIRGAQSPHSAPSSADPRSSRRRARKFVYGIGQETDI